MSVNPQAEEILNNTKKNINTNNTNNIQQKDDDKHQMDSKNKLITFYKNNDIAKFKEYLTANKDNLSKKTLNQLLLFLISGWKILCHSYIQKLIPLIDININIYENPDYKKNPAENFKSILMLCCELCDETLFGLIRESDNLDVNLLDNNKRNALFYLNGKKIEDKKFIEFLINKGINIDQRDVDGNTALHFAILEDGKEKLVTWLMELGKANFMILNNNNKTAVDLIFEKHLTVKNNSSKDNLYQFNNNNKYIYNNLNNNINNSNYQSTGLNTSELKKIIKIIKERLSIKNKVKPMFLENLNDKNNINFSNVDLINNYKRINEYKRKIVKLLKNSEINLKENSLKLKDELEKKKIQLKSSQDYLRNYTAKTENDNSNYTNKIQQLTQQQDLLNQKLQIIKNDLINKKLPNYDLNIKSDNKETNINNNININMDNNINNNISNNNNINNPINQINPINNNQINEINSLPEIKITNNETSNTQTSSEIPSQPETFEIFNDILPGQNILYKFNCLNSETSVFSYSYITHHLQIDLLEFAKFVKNETTKSEENITKIKKLMEESILESLGPNYSITIYGSRATGLCLPWSDVDFVIIPNEQPKFDPLSKFNEHLKKKDFIFNINYISTASIPLIKVQTTNDYQRINLDITMENQRHHGSECVNFIKEKMLEYEVLTPITLAIKNLLSKANLNDPYKGGLSSYGVVLLIINFLKLQINKGVDISINNLGKLFYDFLHFYGKDFDPSSTIIFLDEDQNTFQQVLTYFESSLYSGGLIIVDPLNPQNNVGKNTRQFSHIKLAFMISYNSAKESCECGCHYQFEGLSPKEQAIEHNLLLRMFNSVKRDNISDEYNK